MLPYGTFRDRPQTEDRSLRLEVPTVGLQLDTMGPFGFESVAKKEVFGLGVDGSAPRRGS